MRRLFLLASTVLLITLITTLGIGYSALDNISQKALSQQAKTAKIETQTKTLGAQTETAQNETASYATLIIYASDGISTSYLLDVNENTTAYSLLVNAQEIGEITMEVEEYDFGILVKSINGFENSSESAWIYFVNGESGNVGADQYLVEFDDVVEWKFVKPEF